MASKYRKYIHRYPILRSHSAVILPILVLYIYLLFFSASVVKYSSGGGNGENLKNNKFLEVGLDNEIHSDWQNVHHPAYNFSVYSAYSFVDGPIPTTATTSSHPGSSSMVQVITAYRSFENDQKHPVKCRFYFEDEEGNQFQELSVVTPGHIQMIPGWDFRFAGNFIQCPIPTETDDINDIPDHPMKKPTTVSILIANQSRSDNRLKINYLSVQSELEPSYNFELSLCTLPIFGGDHQVFHFLEWFEFYKMMGVQQFTFYNMSIGPELSCVMKTLQKEVTSGSRRSQIKINILPWKQYPVQNFSVPSFGHGLSAASNDCLMRHKGGNSKYLLMGVNFDEFLTPSKGGGFKNYGELLSFLDGENETRKYGEYLFKTGYLERSAGEDKSCSYLKNSPLEYQVCKELFLVKFDKMRGHFQPWEDYQATEEENGRGKYVVRPERVKIAGHHGVIQMENGEGFESKKVSEHWAYSRHFNDYGSYNYFNYLNGNKGDGGGSKVDKVTVELAMKLGKNVGQSLEYFMDRCGLTLGDVF